MKKNILKQPVPPLFLVGAIFILLPIFIFVTIQNINRQQESATRMLIEKGAALIQSFEAGARFGMRGTGWGNRRLQQLLSETAQQSDIQYLFVTDKSGQIFVHNDSSQIDKQYDLNLDYQQILDSPKIQWRKVTLADGTTVFEVFKKFTPRHRMMGMHHMRHKRSNPPLPRGLNRQRKQVIFVGFDLQSRKEANNANILNAIMTGLILFLAGATGITLLYFFQNYRSAKSALTQVQAFSDTLVEKMPIGLAVIDVNHKVTILNSTAKKNLGIGPANDRGDNAQDVLPKELWKQIKNYSRKKEILVNEVDCTFSDGIVKPMEISISTLQDESGKFQSYIMLFRDQSEIQHLKKEVARSHRLASIGKLAAGVAHEIRNPLSSIKGFATYFKERYQDIPEDQQTANIMINEVDRLDRVVGQLLDLAKPVTITPWPLSINKLILSSLKLVEQQAGEKGIKLQTSIIDHPPLISVDGDKMNQLLLNLYLNSIEAMNSGGTLSVELAIKSDQKVVELSVSDTGEGIKKEDLSRIFDPYYTTKPSGTGIGLAMVHNIVEAHNGTIVVQSNPGYKTQFKVTLPMTNEEKSHE